MKVIDNYHILTGIITDEVYIGTIRKKESKDLGDGNCVSENKVNRTNEFNQAIISLYKNSTWKISSDKETHYCAVLDKTVINKNKDLTLKEFFKLEEDASLGESE